MPKQGDSICLGYAHKMLTVKIRIDITWHYSQTSFDLVMEVEGAGNEIYVTYRYTLTQHTDHLTDVVKKRVPCFF